MSLESIRAWEFQLHYGNLKALNGGNPIRAIVGTCGFEDGAVAHAKRFWHGVFQDFAELRKFFPDYADQFGPYAEPAPEVRTDHKADIIARLAKMKAAREDWESNPTPGGCGALRIL